MLKSLIILIIVALSSYAFAENKTNSKNIPRQKIQLLGLVNSKAPKEISVLDLEKMPDQIEFDLIDPYNKETKTHFYNVPFIKVIEPYMQKEVHAIKVHAIDGYSVEIKIKDIKSIPLYLAYKDNSGYLSIDRMGPVRIIENRVGKIDQELLAKIGVNWVWQLKSLEFIK